MIACGAGFPADIAIITPRSFLLFVVTGSEDFNNPEVQSVARKLEGSSPRVRLAVFEGGHIWLPPQVATEAVQWLEVQAMNSGIRERNPALIKELFDHALSRAAAAESEGDKYRAYRIYAGMTQDFAGLQDLVEVEKKAKELSARKEIIDVAKQEKQIEDEQFRRVRSIQSLIAAHEVADDKFQSLVALREALKSQREAAKANEPSPRRTVARRVIESLFIEFVERGNTALAQNEYDKAVAYYSVCTEIQPDNARIYYFIARTHALSGSRSKALAALKTAADKGFAGVQDLSAKEFEDFQSDKRFKEILDLVKTNQNRRQ